MHDTEPQYRVALKARADLPLQYYGPYTETAAKARATRLRNEATRNFPHLSQETRDAFSVTVEPCP